MCGDQQQQQPIETKGCRTTQAKGILYEKEFYKSCIVFNFLEQHRCSDPLYQEYLNTLRYFKPSEMLLQELQAHRVLCTVDPPTDSHISDVLKTHADAVVLTVSRAATHAVNRVVIDKLFRDQVRSPDIQYDNDLPPSALYKTMRVMITQNRDKKHGVINGQGAQVINFQNKTVFLRLPNQRAVAIHLVTEVSDDNVKRTFYPIIPAYASTICKVQGQTLKKIMLWLDCPKVPEGTAYVGSVSSRECLDASAILATFTAGRMALVAYP